MNASIKILHEAVKTAKNGNQYTEYWVLITIGNVEFIKKLIIFK